ncbi:hypothetical protein HORIV_13910 [Vreelandella olivaria]|uniref:Uncharacterized protein n=1 Tax=Vreelandella olivaria TaxID=390919 RepID=A0ABN5WQA3_9GAMM|nr:hypothetical protein HORIV_13910 [Halomonas olivaria]
MIRREPLLWAVGMNQQPLLSDPLPLALYSPGADVFREVAEQALQSAGAAGALLIPANPWRGWHRLSPLDWPLWW